MNNEIDGRKPLHYASDFGQTDVVRYLISLGADVNVSLFFNQFIGSVLFHFAFVLMLNAVYRILFSFYCVLNVP